MADDDIRGGEAVALLSLAGAVTVLRRSEDLLPVSEERRWNLSRHVRRRRRRRLHRLQERQPVEHVHASNTNGDR